jgi:hypothetical protein
MKLNVARFNNIFVSGKCVKVDNVFTRLGRFKGGILVCKYIFWWKKRSVTKGEYRSHS